MSSAADAYVNPLLDPEIRKAVYARARQLEPAVFAPGYIGSGYTARARAARSARYQMVVRRAGAQLGHEIRVVLPEDYEPKERT